MLIKCSAICVFFGAVLLGTGYLLRIDIQKEEVFKMITNKALTSSLLVTAGSLMIISGFPGVFLRHTATSVVGYVAHSMSFAGLAAFHLGTIALYFVLPVLVNYSDSTRSLIYSDEPPFPRFALFWATSLFLQSAGLIWLSVKIWKKTIFPKAVSLFLIAGALAFLAAPLTGFSLLKPANTILMIGLCIAAWARYKKVAGIRAEHPSALFDQAFVDNF